MNTSVFCKEMELKRLAVQRTLLYKYEQPIYKQLIQERKGLTLLDVGCNDGSKTIERFSREYFSKVIGIDCLESLLGKTQKQFHDEVYTFRFCDVNEENFSERIENIMKEEGVTSFDIINCSFILMHLKNPLGVLKELRKFLSQDGKMVIIEPDDTESVMIPDEKGLFKEFLEVLSSDPYAGKRDFGKHIPKLLMESGYTQYELKVAKISAQEDEREKKESIFITFCSYLPEDLVLLRKQYPENKIYRKSWKWVEDHFDNLHSQMVQAGTEISMGIKIYTCKGE